MQYNNVRYNRDEIPDAFASYFKNKVENITNECQIDDNVYNGTRLMNVGNENFMSEINLKRCLMGLKIKNCEGVDRIPLRILNDGAEILCRPITDRMNIIYGQSVILHMLPLSYDIKIVIILYPKIYQF